MHVPATPTSGTHDHKTLLQVEAYLTHNLNITTQLVDNTRSRLTSIETQLATPAAASGKAKKTLRSTRAKLAKQLRKCRTEAEMLTRAIDEVKTKIAAADVISGRRLSVLATGSGGYVSSPVDGMSERSSSISSYISSGELSSSQAVTYQQPLLFSPVAGTLPYIHTNIPMAISSHNLPSAPIWPVAPYGMASPYSSGWPVYSDYTIASPEVQHPVSAYGYYPYGPAEFYGSNPESAQFDPSPLPMPLESTTWDFQQSPISDVHTVVAPERASKRHSIAVMSPLSDSAIVLGRHPGHKRGASATIEEIVSEWDMGS